MGAKGSKPAAAAAANAPPTGQSLDWPLPPEKQPTDEQDPLDLVLTAWASCKAKPAPGKMPRSDVEERRRRQELSWRKRSSFLDLDCGEDAFFVSNTYKTVGVADGVGGWREHGVDPSQFSNSLMHHAKWYSETHREDLDPESIITNAFEKVKRDAGITAGSATACCASLRRAEAAPAPEASTGALEGSAAPDSAVGASKYFLDVANLGDSGAIVIRDKKVIHRFHEKVHGFNCPFQLSILPAAFRGKCYSDTMRSAVRESVEVAEGDVIVLGTDGLFDNRFATAIARDAGWIGRVENSPYDMFPLIGPLLKAIAGPQQRIEYSDPYRVTQKIVQEAYRTSVDKDARTPWAAALMDFGVDTAKGGKPDDITVIVAKVMTRDDATRTTMW